MKIREIIQHLESVAPLEYQEEYDNSGLIAEMPKRNVPAYWSAWTVPNKRSGKPAKKNVISLFPITR